MSKQALTERVNFELIRYANCWEDADVLLKGLAPAKGSKILSIGSAGDNSFSLLTTDPEMVVAVDINKIQLFLIELKRACISNLDREETLAFLGFTASTNRKKCFDTLKNGLSSPAKAYWESNLPLIESGVIHQGKFEKYFQLFSGKVLPWIHSQKTVRELFSTKTKEQQEAFYNEKWNTWRWRLLFRIFFSNRVMGKYGRDPEFLKQVEGSVSEFIFNKAAQHLRSQPAQENFILRYALSGRFDHLLPHYLQQENYDMIRSNISRLHLKHGFAQAAINEHGSFDCMNLSDIFEYMDMDLFRETAQTLIDATRKDGRLAYWNLMVPRKMSQLFPADLACYHTLSENLTAMDKGFFYKEFIVEQKK
jgi:S-adenosylmethionine-diacylglycerol 3-amino-3-carboxypropyl transferase